MSATRKAGPAPLFLGIEGGGTRTVALLADAAGRLIQRSEAGPGNVRLLSDAQLLRLLRGFQRAMPRPSAVALGMAGTVTPQDRERIRAAASKVWPGTRCSATHDLETALAAAELQAGGDSGLATTGRRQSPIGHFPSRIPLVLILSGTGSFCYGRARSGQTVKVGGWGHLLGDRGSGYELGLRALKAVIHSYDHAGDWSNLGQRLLRALQLNEPAELIGWVQNAAKTDIAALAAEVFAAWDSGDKLASRLVAAAADILSEDAAACARRLTKPRAAVEFVLAGSVLLKQPRFARLVAARLKRRWPRARVRTLQRESAWGAVELARQHYLRGGPPAPPLAPVPSRRGHARAESPATPPLEDLHQSPTEQRNPRSANLDRLPLRSAIELMLSEDEQIPAAIRREGAKIERAIQLIVRSFRRGGRLFYVGAGTSGRLGVLDASECPPTFSTPPELVQGLIAGGQRALWESVEGAEDDADPGARAIELRGVGKKDVVVGIAASGRTPFVWGALHAAQARGARTILLCFNPSLRVARGDRPDLVIAPNVGPEVLTGSTRLKAGTATKLILNLFTTLAMVRLGKVVSNLMVDLNPANTKLRDRAVRIVCELTGAEPATAREALEKSDWEVKPALKLIERKDDHGRVSVSL
ncbi:MAG: N-acetylmuramic acid 6-phosphate etherase [Verrucomicrobia bacterium]|nr:N-acetylmuramic acid 6-phosphate etherase [Verrucomicrobiota bacterium]